MKKLMIGLLASSLLVSNVSVVFANSNSEIINELQGKQIMIYGGGSSKAQRDEMDELLGLNKSVQKSIVQGTDVDNYLGTSGVETSSLYSSVYLTVVGDQGVNVDIKTPENITKVTELQYANAALTAGAENMEIDVVSPVKVTGESALTGVYKAMELMDLKMDEDRLQAANEELQTTSGIAQNHESNEKFDPVALDLTLAQIKSDLAEYKNDNNKVAGNAKVENIVHKALADNGLDGILSDNEIAQLVSFAQTYQQTGAVDSKEMADQLKKYSESAKDKLSEKFKDFKDNEEVKGFGQSVSNFFKNLMETITGWFK